MQTERGFVRTNENKEKRKGNPTANEGQCEVSEMLAHDRSSRQKDNECWL